jgi:hypothetical protein
MRGFLLTAMVLIGLDVVVHSPASNVATAFEVPTRWLAEWMDPRTPLIAAPGTTAPQGKNASSSTSGGSGFNPVGYVAGAVGSFFKQLIP